MSEPSGKKIALGAASPERPIEQPKDDKLERSRFIERLTSALINSDLNKATGVVVGITGPWGSGKSSILNLCKNTSSKPTRMHSWCASILGSFRGGMTSLPNFSGRSLEQ